MSRLENYLFLVHFKGGCLDSDNGKTDIYSRGCKSLYNEYPGSCGSDDDDDFFANSMCCACIGKFFL